MAHLLPNGRGSGHVGCRTEQSVQAEINGPNRSGQPFPAGSATIHSSHDLPRKRIRQTSTGWRRQYIDSESEIGGRVVTEGNGPLPSPSAI
jgi:hypothetical protein